MSESAGVRRSARRTSREKKPAFQPGDIVEVTRSRSRSKARLVTKLNDSSSVSPKWLVAFDDGESWTEDEMYESSFGSVVGKADLSKLNSNLSTKTNAKRVKKQKRVASHSPAPAGNQPLTSSAASAAAKTLAVSSSPTANDSSPSPSSKQSPTMVSSPDEVNGRESNGGKKKNKKKRDADSAAGKKQPAKDAPSDSSETKNAAAAARAARSLRRQAKLEEEHSKRMPAPAAKKAKTVNSNKDPNVVRVPMLTGTLILYRGSHPRAEFVYKK